VNKFTKKAVSMLLSVVIILSCFATVAYAKQNEYDQTCPLINVPGFMATNIYKDKDSGNSKIWPPSPTSIISGVSKLIPSIAKVASDKDWDTFGTNLMDALDGVFGPLMVDSKGNIQDNSGIHFEYPAEDTIKKNSTLDFQYDWRLDPLDSAEKLNDFINYVIKASGSKKVCLSCHSCGGVIVVSYISKYGTSKLKGVIMNSTAVYGETFTGELLTGELEVSSSSVNSFLKLIYGKSDYEYTIETISKMLKDAGLLNFIDTVYKEINENLYDRLAKEMVLPMFAYWLNIWAMVPDEYFNDAYSYVFETMLGENGVNYSVLKSKINKYNKSVRKGKTSTLKKINNNCRLGVFSRYGFSSMPLTPSWEFQGDTVIDTKYTSFGATVANYKSELTEKQINASKPEMISPDKTIDASTCLFPEKTWFIKNYSHFNADILLDLQYMILYSKEEITVNSLEEYPRYLIYNSDKMTVTADENLNRNFLTELVSPIRKIIVWAVSLFSSLFGSNKTQSK